MFIGLGTLVHARWAPALGEVGGDDLADQTIVGAASQFGLDSFHHLAHVRLGRGSQFGNRRLDDIFHLRLRKLFRQVGFQHRQLRLLLFDQIRAPAFLETLDGILPLFDLLLDDSRDVRVRQLLLLFFDLVVFDRRFQQAQGRQAGGILGAHRVLHVGCDFVHQHAAKTRRATRSLSTHSTTARDTTSNVLPTSGPLTSSSPRLTRTLDFTRAARPEYISKSIICPFFSGALSVTRMTMPSPRSSRSWLFSLSGPPLRPSC